MTDNKTLDQNEDRDYSDVWDELEDVSAQFAGVRPRKDRQLNLRVDADLLGTLRLVAANRGEGYHSLARRLIEEGLARAHEPLPTEAPARSALSTNRPFRLKEVLLVLLGQPGATGEVNEPIEGKTRLQKLLFLAAQHLRSDVAARFEAYSYGPFEEEVGPDIEFLASEGLVDWHGRGPDIPPEVQDESERGIRIVEWVRRRASAEPRPIESYRLTQLGIAWLRRFFSSSAFGTNEAKERLADECRVLKERFGRVPLDELVDFVYAEYPEFAEHSRIRDAVAERRARKVTAEAGDNVH